MGSPRRSREPDRAAETPAKGARVRFASSALEEKVQAIKRWERAILLARSKAEQVSDWIACTAGSGPVLPSQNRLGRQADKLSYGTVGGVIVGTSLVHGKERLRVHGSGADEDRICRHARQPLIDQVFVRRSCTEHA